MFKNLYVQSEVLASVDGILFQVDPIADRIVMSNQNTQALNQV